MEPHQDVCAGQGQAGQAWVIGAQAGIAFHLPQRVAMQRQFREHHQVETLGGGAPDHAVRLLLDWRRHHRG